MNLVIPPASKFLAAIASRKNSEAYSKWKDELPELWIESFIKYGVKPFLNKYGYSLGFSDSRCIQYCKRWAFAHLSRGIIDPIDWAHEGGEEEYEWYQDTISILEWNEFARAWQASEFLDSSDAGYNQNINLSKFIWQCISLEGSSRHTEWLDSLEEEESAEQFWISDDSHAYGGDRRTY